MAISKITSAGVATDTLVAGDIAADAVGSSEIAANAVGTSEIATGGVLPANIAYLGDGSGNLSGTITNQQLHFGTAFTLTDDLTVNGDLTLAKVRDDGLGQSITGSGRTLTGTGTLTMGSYVEGEPKNRTKERQSLPSTSASDLDSGTLAVARMAAGTMINTVSNSYATATSITAYSAWNVDFTSSSQSVQSTGLTCQITPTSTSNKILVTINLYYRIDGDYGSFGVKVYDGTSYVLLDANVNAKHHGVSGNEDIRDRYSFTYWATPPSAGSLLTYTVYAAAAETVITGGAATLVMQHGSQKSYMTLQEIAQ